MALFAACGWAVMDSRIMQRRTHNIDFLCCLLCVKVSWTSRPWRYAPSTDVRNGCCKFAITNDCDLAFGTRFSDSEGQLIPTRLLRQTSISVIKVHVSDTRIGSRHHIGSYLVHCSDCHESLASAFHAHWPSTPA